MRLLVVLAFLALVTGILASVSNINLNPTGEYAKLSPKGGLYVSVVLLIYVLFAEMGFLPYRFRGRKRRSAMAQVMNPLIMGDKDVVLRVYCSRSKKSETFLIAIFLVVDSCDRQQRLPFAISLRIGSAQSGSSKDERYS